MTGVQTCALPISKEVNRITEHDYPTGNEITSIKVKNHFPKARENLDRKSVV